MFARFMLAFGAIALLSLPALSEENSLAGSAWTGGGEPVTVEAITAAAAQADLVLVGEIHTNPEHHMFQAAVIKAMVAAGRKPAVVFEMVPRSMQPVLDGFSGSAAELGEALEWEKRGWPDWEIYRPIAEAALAAGLPLVAGDLDREAMREAGAPEIAYPEEALEGLRAELIASHCDLLPEEAIAPMMGVQQARDMAMAKAMLDAEGDGAVLIAGGGHVRADWGVPFLLGELAPEKTVLAIGQFEVLPDRPDFGDYLDEGAAALPYDYVTFAERSDTTDHCAELRKQFGK